MSMSFDKALINKNAAIFLLLLAIIYLAYVLADLIWFVNIDNRHTVQTSKIISDNKQYQYIPTDIFGDINKKNTKKVNYKNIKTTKLNLLLIGIVKNLYNSYAIIKHNNGKSIVLKIGDKIGNTKLIEINNNFVIFSRNGNKEKLAIDFKYKNFNHKTTKIITKQLDYNQKNILKTYLKAAQTNPAKLLAIIKLEPNFINGKLHGFIVYPSIEKRLFKKIGFLSGDIILNINNIELNDIKKSFKIGKELASSNIFNITIKRNNTTQYINIDLN